MAGNVVYAVLPTHAGENHVVSDMQLGQMWERLVREKMIKVGAVPPKRIHYYGAFGDWISMKYTTNVMFLIVNEAATELGMKFLRGNHQGRSYKGLTNPANGGTITSL